MKGQDKLYKLIHSLSSSEKRYFKLYINRFIQKEKFYSLKIYNILVKQKEYDEDKLYKKLQDQIDKKRLAVEKFNLFELILDGLNNYYSKSYVDIELMKAVQNIQILCIKGLLIHAQDQIDKYKKIAYKADNHFGLLYLLKLEMELVYSITPMDKVDHIIGDLIEEASNKLSNLSEIYAISKIVSAYNNIIINNNARSPKIVSQLQKIRADNPILEQPEKLQSLFAIHCTYRIRCHIALFCKEYPKMQLLAKEVIHFLETEDERFNKHLTDYFHYTKVLSSYLMTFLYGDLDGSKDELISRELHKLKTIPDRFDSSSKIHSIIHQQILKGMAIVLQYYLLRDKKEQVLPLIEEILVRSTPHKKLARHINRDDILVLHFLSVAYFYLNDYNEAWEYNNKVIASLHHKSILNLTIPALVFNLIIHYELDNYQLLEYQLDKVDHKIKKIDGSFQWELTLIKYLKKMITYQKSDLQLDTYFNELKLISQKLFEDPFEKEANIYFNYSLWMDQKIKSFSL